MFRTLTTATPITFFRTSIRNIASQVLHVTDTEGTNFALKAFQKSKILSVNSDNGLQFNKVDGIPHLIYGGDATDRGRHDLAITEMLVDFKKRHPDQVTLLVGNREIKNTRFAVELHPETIRERLLKTASPYWIPNLTLPLDYVIAEMKRSGKQTTDEMTEASIQHYVYSLTIEKCQIIYLKWMLEKTMGSPNTFRYRREELSALTQKSNPSEEEVLHSFIKETQPTGLMGEYLGLAQVGVIVPNTGILAVHGGLTNYNVGRIPNMQDHETPIQDAKQWLTGFNQWYQEQIQKWIHFKPNHLNQPGQTPLDQCVLPVPGKQKYVITADMLNAQRQFVTIPENVNQYINRNKLSIVLTGHQPCGDHPCIIRNTSNNALFINGDTGYAIESKNPDDTRGHACHTVEIAVDDKLASHVEINATLPDKTAVKTELCVLSDTIEGDPYIGIVLPDHRLIQCRLPNGDYRLAEQKGFAVTYSTVQAENMAALMALPVAIKPL
ncbi:MAG: hypothetical protein P4M14_00385 [Gammaproteobacteria bacterium]|nr:hypothetical protein [Gammaproteobacteria bacterium]